MRESISIREVSLNGAVEKRSASELGRLALGRAKVVQVGLHGQGPTELRRSLRGQSRAASSAVMARSEGGIGVGAQAAVSACQAKPMAWNRSSRARLTSRMALRSLTAWAVRSSCSKVMSGLRKRSTWGSALTRSSGVVVWSWGERLRTRALALVGEHAGAVEVQVRREGEAGDEGGEAPRDVGMAEPPAHDVGVLALGEGVFVGLARARLGELRAQVLEQLGASLTVLLGRNGCRHGRPRI